MPTEQFNAWCELKYYLCNKYSNMPVYGHREKGESEYTEENFHLIDLKVE
jgi:N-acetylmuramoyl-L-alanine amidase